MKRWIIFISLVLAGNYGINAQLLWKISGKGLKKPSYILGTHYLIPLVYIDSIKQVYKSFNECDLVLGDIVTNAIEAKTYLEKTSLLALNESLYTYIPLDKQQKVDEELKSVLKIGLKELSRMQPELILRLYKTELFKQITGVEDDAQSDSYFQIAANAKDIKVIAFSSLEEQVNENSHVDIQQQTNNLMAALLEKNKISEKLLQFNQLYRQGKIDNLQFVDVNFLANERKADTQFDLKNDKIFNTINQVIPKNSCFITVDVFRLSGEKSLLKQLTRAGYKLKAVE